MRREAVKRRGAQFEQVMSRHATPLFRYALALTRDRLAAEDLVQETFLRSWRAFHTLREPAKARAWLLTTLRREYFRQFERYQPEFAEVDVEDLRAGDDAPSPEVAALRAAIFALPPAHRDVLALQALFGYSGTEIGELLGLPRATVNTRLFRARQQLRKVLRGDADRPERTGRGREAPATDERR